MRDAHNMQKAYEGVWANTGASAEDTSMLVDVSTAKTCTGGASGDGSPGSSIDEL